MTITLAVIIFLTQSLRFLELVINSGASGGTFWILTLLALPRFFEMILPIAVMAATFFIYNRMSTDSELVVLRAAGYSSLSLGRPAIILAGLVTVFLWIVTMWMAPASLSSMKKMQQVIKAQFSTLLFREGVFNAAGPGLTFYLRERTPEGELLGLMIHDSREKNKVPSTILAKRGTVVAKDEGHEILVYDGSRQEFNEKTGTLSQLNFERYIIEIPDSAPVRRRWKEPDERTIFELLSPDPENTRDMENLREFRIEIHRRAVSPLLTLVFTMMALVFLLPGPVDRRGQGLSIVLGIAAVVGIEGLYLASFNIARNSAMGLVFMYLLTLIPLFLSFLTLSAVTEPLWRRARRLYGVQK